MTNATYEFILWPNCRNHCSFCFQKEQLRQGKIHELTFENMRKSMTLAAYEMSQIPRGSHVMLVGGELFDSPQIHFSLSNLLNYVLDLMENGQIGEFYLNTNLIYKRLDPVLEFLSVAESKGLFPRLHFTTSYDFDGRFVPATHRLMLKNLEEIAKTFQDLPIYINTMLSKRCCEAILSNTFLVPLFAQTFHAYVNLIPYIELIPQLTASRTAIVQTLQKVDSQLPGYIADYLARLDLNQEKYVLQFIDGKFLDCSCPLAPCGHAQNFTRYSNSGTCYVCDMKRVFGL